MNVRWPAVFLGWLVDFSLSLFIQLFPSGFDAVAFSNQPDLSRPSHLGMMSLLILATGVGGYVAGRRAHESHVLNGLMVGVVGILVSAFLNTFLANDSAIPGVFVLAQIVGCGVAALGGYLSSLHRP